MEHLERNRSRRQAATAARRAPSDSAYQGATLLHVVENDAGVLAAGVTIGRHQRFQPETDVARLRIRVGHRAGGADGRAAAATRAQVRLDLDVVAVRRDGAGRADVEAFGAAGDARAPMRADFFAVLEE